jgi:hypothetical protein
LPSLLKNGQRITIGIKKLDIICNHRNPLEKIGSAKRKGMAIVTLSPVYIIRFKS